MTDVIEPRLNRRQRAKAVTRQKVLSAARCLFTAKGYADASIRDIAREAGMSTGAVFANFDSKGDLWRAVKGQEPPVETPLTRAAPAMFDALRALQAVRPSNWDDDEDPALVAAWLSADEAVAAAEGRA